ncbi:RagB/SusD family nutrient uptake outer membrane protein [Pedobacter sp. PLR]|uniref:RagB/SusD family nutrient uptake outer membrane protein n=1 Tax=Pedobacter sp. PLR TaxID=2994465 RepID=UPI002245C341|nr:RagB/SusD family nutrient uptake outer membrane protein [Pedobacter sp. PLR]MCX2453327.1 RagB/SusD family nutrient uptake outer membrane protein [Pedobacter sp. PLR]
MKKRSSIYLLTGLLTLTSITACQKDFLERPPLNELSEDTFWKRENDVYQAVMGIYAKMPGDGIVYDDGATDNAHVQNAWESTASSVSAGTMSSTEDAGWDFKDIRRVNYFLENADKVTVISADLLERYKAEVRFLRAYSYFRMMNSFGDVPLVTKVLALGEENLPRTPKKEVLAFVLSELEAVSKILPAQYAGGRPNEKGRITKGAALALKARALLFEGDYQQAAATAAEVMGLGYDLFTTTEVEKNDQLDDYTKWVDFADADDKTNFLRGLRNYERLFYQKSEGNKEVILDRQHIPQIDANYLNTYLPPATLGGWSSVTPTQSMVDAYGDYKTGEAIVPVGPAQRADWYANDKVSFAKEYKNRDPRFYASILFDGAEWNGIEAKYVFKWTAGNNFSRTGYNFRKMVDPAFYDLQIDNHANVILIRYAEILLTYAEAKNEVSGPDNTIYEALDKIRTRAGMPVVNRTKYASKEALREFIRAERRVELALEGQRYMDIRRWKIAPTVMKSIVDVKNSQIQQRVWSDKLYLMPVPQIEIDKSKGVLVQTPGY